MPFVIAAPETLEAAADALQKTWYDMADSKIRAESETTSVVAPGSDMVSQEVQRFLAAHADQYRVVCERALLIFDKFGESVSRAADLYLTAEIANAADVS